MIELDEFQKELTALINKHSIDNHSNTPDFVLAEYMIDALMAYRSAKSRADNLKLGGPFATSGGSIESVQDKINQSADEVIKRTQYKDIVCLKCGHVTEVNLLSGPVRFPIECPNCK